MSLSALQQQQSAKEQTSATTASLAAAAATMVFYQFPVHGTVNTFTSQSSLKYLS